MRHAFTLSLLAFGAACDAPFLHEVPTLKAAPIAATGSTGQSPDDSSPPSDVDECLGNACGEHASACMNLPGSFACQCQAGWSTTGVGAACTDVDECSAGAPCGSGTCTNVEGSYACTCPVGYGSAPTGGTCSNVDECMLATHDCDPDTLCSDTVGGFACSVCPNGLIGNAKLSQGGCLLDTPELTSLGFPELYFWNPAFNSAGGGFAAQNNMKRLTFSPVAAFSERLAITVDGVPYTGSPMALTLDIVPQTRHVSVTSQTGKSASYDVSVTRATSTLKPWSPDNGDYYGDAVAMSADAQVFAIGAWFECSSATGPTGDPYPEQNDDALGAGAVYIHQIQSNGTLSTPLAYLKASNTDAYDNFGQTLAISADGTTLAVGAPGESSNAKGVPSPPTGQSDNSKSYAGAVYVFVRSGTTWTQQAYIKASNTDTDDRFGTSIALSSDGSTLAVGAFWESSCSTVINGGTTAENDNACAKAGAVYIYKRSMAGGWAKSDYIKPTQNAANTWFGSSVAFSANARVLAVGAERENTTATKSGAVFVFNADPTTGAWSQVAFLKAQYPGDGDDYGHTVALSGDGTLLAVGAMGEDSSGGGVKTIEVNSEAAADSGAVYLYKQGTSWARQVFIKAQDVGASDGFGTSVALSQDGSHLVVGSPGEDSCAVGMHAWPEFDAGCPDAGAAYIYAPSGNSWILNGFAKGYANEPTGDWAGRSLAIDAIGSNLMVGASRANPEYSTPTTGAVAFY